jgi:hypothetical protein
VAFPTGATTTLAAPTGARVLDPEVTDLTTGAFVVAWRDAFSHSLQANYAVFDPAGQLLTEAGVGNGFTSDLEVVATPGGGFVLADADADLFGQHATLTVESFNHNGQATGSAVTLQDQTSPTGGLFITGVEGQFARGHLSLAWDDEGQSYSAEVWPHGQGHTMGFDQGPVPMTAPEIPPFHQDAWFG